MPNNNSSKIKIAFQGLFLNRPYTGIGNYCSNLLKELSEVDQNKEYHVIVPEKSSITDVLEQNSNLRIHVLPFGSIAHAGLRMLYWEQIQVPSLIKKLKVDMAHFPYPANPWYSWNVPTIVTVHDTIPWENKEYRGSFLARLKAKQTKRALTRAKLILTVSKSSAESIAQQIPSLREKIDVIYNAPSGDFLKKTGSKKQAATLEKYQLGAKPYLLYVGGYDSRKNVKTLADAFTKRVAPNHDIDLVCVGDKLHMHKLYDSLDYLTLLVKEPSINLQKGQIRLTGYVSEEELASLYQGALAFVNISRQEGFNIPLIQAAALKVPVITSDIPVHKELLREYAVFCDPEDEGDVATKILSLIDPLNYKKIKTKCDNYDLQLSWRKSAKKLITIYDRVYNNNKRN